MQQKEIRLEGRMVRYREAGQGPCLILLHGFGEDSTVWQEQYGAFPQYRLILPDLPGSGSDAIEDLSMEGMARWLRGLLQELDVRECVLIGHSMGGYIALAFAEAFGNMLKGLGLFHSTAYADSEEKKEARQKGIAAISQNGAFAFLKTATPNLFSPETRAQRPQLVEAQIQASGGLPADSLIGYYRAMIARPDRTSVLRNARWPVLFVLGRHDGAVPLQQGLEQCPLPERCWVHLLEHSGHMGMREEERLSNELMSGFLEEVL